MMSPTGIVANPYQVPTPAFAAPARLPRTWPALLLLAIFWTIYSVHRWTDLGVSLGFMGFLVLLGAAAVITLLFVFWWLFASRVRLAERFGVLAVAVAAGFGAGALSHRSVVPFLLIPGWPLVLTAWALALVAVRSWQPRPRTLVLAGVLAASCGALTLIRAEGMSGDGQLALRWRWSLTPEQRYLATLAQSAQPVAIAEKTGAVPQPALSLQPGDWPGFRGPNRDGNLRGVRIATYWNLDPPRRVWRRQIGPAWSSVVVVGDRLFTQEQLGDQEAVVCLDAATGQTLWWHKDTARHEDVQSGAGPRATPTFSEGRLFTLGATGILNCLDATTGERNWHRDIAADAGTSVPMWGFSSSPLVVGDLVVVFAGGDTDRTLLAYHTDSGKPAWSAAAGKRSYSSAQLASVGGETQLLFVSDGGLFAFEPSTGTALWEHHTPAGNPGVPRTVQPQAVGRSEILFDAGPDLGTALIGVAHQDGSWTPTERWITRQLKPNFNDFVIHENALYGFDGRVLTCIDTQTGQRRWKDGRYGSGQVLLLGDQPLLLVVTDEGQVVLVEANPNKHHELCRFQALEGKTWSHPVIAGGRLYLRNADEIACYELRLEEPR
jgi:outer membrane protein assembly factor BamB